MTDNRVQKIIKGILDEYQDDRDKALEGYMMFLGKINGDFQNAAGLDLVKGMIDCLKLAQGASSNKLKVVDICIKLNAMMKASENKGLKDLNKQGQSSSIFAALDSVIGERSEENGDLDD